MPAETLPNNENQEVDSVLKNLVKETEDDFFQIANKYDEIEQALEANPDNQELREKEEKLRNYLEEVSELNKKYLESLNENSTSIDKKMGEAATFTDVYSEQPKPEDSINPNGVNVNEDTGRVTGRSVIGPDGNIINLQFGKPDTKRYEGR